VTVGGVPHASQVAQDEMDIVEEIGHKALGATTGGPFSSGLAAGWSPEGIDSGQRARLSFPL